MLKKSFVFLLLICNLSNAEVITDGTLGQQINLPGPDFQITSDLGQQHGSNLFHSFQDFNLNSLESATFSGPNSINNIISRVTGGNPSNIDGLIRSTIPNADFYFLNPYGIMFGPNARLDVQGSFHASTADYLKLNDNGRFDARNPNDSLLTVAPVEAFGFLDNTHGKIEVNGRGVLNESGTPRALLQVPDGKSLSLIGGNIYLSQGVDELLLEGLIDGGTPEEIQAAQYRDQRFSQLYAPGGTINLASIQRAGEIALSSIHSIAMQGGTINLEQQAYISSTGESGGNVFIRAGEFMMDHSTIYARTLGAQDGGIVDIQADNIKLDNFSKIRGGTENTGDGTDIQLSASESIHISNDSPLNTYAGDIPNINQQLGDAGHIRLQAKDIEINRDYSLNGVFSTDTYGTGRGGDLSIIAENSLNIIDAYIQLGTWGDNAQSGKAGDIYLRANTLNVKQGGWVRTIGGTADSGQLVIQAGTIYLGGLNGDYNSQLSTVSFGQGNAGQVIIQADQMLLEDGAYLISTNFADGNAGHIDIQLTGNLTIRGVSDTDGYPTGIFSSVLSGEKEQGGNAGNIHISSEKMQIETGGRIDAGSKTFHPSASSKNAGNITLEIKGALVLSGVNPYGENTDGFGSVISARSQGENAGHAGNINIQADSVSILDGALLETGSDNHSHGGNIAIQADKHITINGDASQITLKEPLSGQIYYLSTSSPETYNQSISGIYANSTNRAADSGNSGNIELSTPQLILSSQISTSSQGGGKAGQIILNIEKLVLSNDALIRSNSDLSNQFVFDSTQARDNTIIGLGTVVKTIDIGNGKSIHQINLGNILLNLMPITHVTDIEALEALPEQINLVSNGELFIVENVGDGQSARFLYVNYADSNQTWTRINENSQVTLEQPDFSLREANFVDGIQPPYTDGTPIHIKDMGNGKSADFVYVVRTFSDGPNVGLINGSPFRIKNYQVTDSSALQDLAASTDLVTGTQVNIDNTGDGNPARFVFDGNGWVRFGKILEVSDIKARENLVLANPGHISHLPTGDTIYTGNEWIDLGNTYRVNNLAERNALNIQHGDLVKVADVGGGHGHFESFLYADGKWIKQIRGGHAGTITINADSIQLTDNSEISTESISGGGGHLTLNVDKLVFVNNSEVSTSVEQSVGDGGNLKIEEPIFIVNNGEIVARAFEGHGGNINLESEKFISSPNSIISASSKLGVSGTVEIESIDMDLDGFLVILSDEVIDASDLMKTPCGQRLGKKLGSFIVKSSEGSYTSPDDLLPSGLLLSDDLPVKETASIRSPNNKLALSTCKHFEHDLTD